MTAQEARKISDANKVSEQQISTQLFNDIILLIKKEAKLGCDYCKVETNKIDSFCIKELVKLGYTTIQQRGNSLGDKNYVKISW